MAGKRKNLKHLDYQSQEYWEALLKEEHLSMRRGTTSKLVYAGGWNDLVILELYQGDMNLSGQNKLGHGPDC